MRDGIPKTKQIHIAAFTISAIALIFIEVSLSGYFPGKLENQDLGIGKPVIHRNTAEVPVSLNSLDRDPSTVMAMGRTLFQSAEASRWGMFDVPKDVDLIAFDFSVTSLDDGGLTHTRPWARLIVERHHLANADWNLNSTTALNLVTSVRFENQLASSMTREFCDAAPSRHLARPFCEALERIQAGK
jgi:hypothetical protein